jgi:CRP/FNR family transcriptional regulator
LTARNVAGLLFSVNDSNSKTGYKNMNISSLPFGRVGKSNTSSKVCLETAQKSNNLKLINSHLVFHARQSLYSAGEPFEGLYILRSGSAKSFITSIDGKEHITKFFYPGDLLGVDGFDEHIYKQNVLFLETSSVCLVKESDLNSLVKSSDDFRNCLSRSMSSALSNDSAMIMCLSCRSSEQKFAHFISELSEQLSSLGLSGTQFRVSMTRTDIANYTGMEFETVSRLFASFQRQQLISVNNRQVTILDMDALHHVAAKGRLAASFTTYLHSKNVISTMSNDFCVR